jgi:hydroxyacylglutathione hydrolase
MTLVRLLLSCTQIAVAVLVLLAGCASGFAQRVAEVGSNSTRDSLWNDGAQDCKASPQPPLEQRSLNAGTVLLREGLCSTFEAPFVYLLMGSKKALLIDTGDVTDAAQMPLAKTVLGLLPGTGSEKLPLLVVHTHRHLDHRSGDAQFANLLHVQVLGYDLESVRRFYNFKDWPNGIAEIDLGDRIVDVLPTPGHNETEVSFYDRKYGLFFSGDFLMPGRLLIDDLDADLASARRAAAFVSDRPVQDVLGGHIEFDAQGETFPWQSQYHPHEHALAMSKGDLLALPKAIESFNGIYSRSGQFVMINPMRLLILFCVMALSVLAALVAVIVKLVRVQRKR